jgi:hypothetical protein
MANDTNDAGKGQDDTTPVAVAPAATVVATQAVAAAVTVAKVAVVASVIADNPEQELTLQEFCQRLSSVDKRVELIGAFHYSETAAGTVKDLESAFADRFAAFLNKPA